MLVYKVKIVGKIAILCGFMCPTVFACFKTSDWLAAPRRCSCRYLCAAARTNPGRIALNGSTVRCG